MKNIEYSEFVNRLAKPGQAILESLTPDKCHLLHMGIGVSGEAGELLDAIKKWVVYGKPLDTENIKEELGDLKFYIQGILNLMEWTDSEIECANRAKLAERYKSLSYSDEAAIAREDKDVK